MRSPFPPLPGCLGLLPFPERRIVLISLPHPLVVAHAAVTVLTIRLPVPLLVIALPVQRVVLFRCEQLQMLDSAAPLVAAAVVDVHARRDLSVRSRPGQPVGVDLLAIDPDLHVAVPGGTSLDHARRLVIPVRCHLALLDAGEDRGLPTRMVDHEHALRKTGRAPGRAGGSPEACRTGRTRRAGRARLTP